MRAVLAADACERINFLFFVSAARRVVTPKRKASLTFPARSILSHQFLYRHMLIRLNLQQVLERGLVWNVALW